MEKLLIGLDFGSDSVRAVLVTENGEQLATSVHEYARWAQGKYCDPAANRFRQHPLDYLEGTEAVIRSVLEGVDSSRVAGIAIDTTGSTPCAVDRAGTPLALNPEFADDPDAMFLLWKDHTAIAEAARINEYAANWGGPDYRLYEGGIYSSEWFWSKILHVLRNNVRVREAAFSWVEHCDWITGELAGRTDPVTMTRSRCAAGHKAMWHASWGGLPSEEFLRGVDPLLAGLRGRLYTETMTADVPVGTLSPKWAARLGLSTEVVIGGSALDCHFGAVGAQLQPGELTVRSFPAWWGWKRGSPPSATSTPGSAACSDTRAKYHFRRWRRRLPRSPPAAPALSHWTGSTDGALPTPIPTSAARSSD